MSAFIVNESTMNAVVAAIATPEERGTYPATVTRPFSHNAVALARAILAGDLDAARGAADEVFEMTRPVDSGEATVSGATLLGRELYKMNQAAVIARYGNRPDDDYQAVPDYTFNPDDTADLEWRAEGDESPAVQAVSCLVYQCSEGDVPTWPLYKRLVTEQKRLEAEWAKGAAERARAKGQTDAARRATEREQHAASHPHLVKKADKPDWSPARLVAENIRRELKRSFPGVKFSVRADGYDSVNVGWTDGPTGKQVDAVIQRYKSGSFDGYTDCFNYDHDNTFGDVFGSCRFVFGQRENTLEGVRKAWAAKGFNPEQVGETWYNSNDQAMYHHIRTTWADTAL